MRCPILFLNGTTDFAYPLDSYQKSYLLVSPMLRQVSIAINRRHGHIWTFPEVYRFVDGVLTGKPTLVRIGLPVVTGPRISAAIDRAGGKQEAKLCYTSDSGSWQQRKWQIAPARIEDGTVWAELPAARPLVAFLTFSVDISVSRSTMHTPACVPARNNTLLILVSWCISRLGNTFACIIAA